MSHADQIMGHDNFLRKGIFVNSKDIGPGRDLINPKSAIDGRHMCSKSSYAAPSWALS